MKKRKLEEINYPKYIDRVEKITLKLKGTAHASDDPTAKKSSFKSMIESFK